MRRGAPERAQAPRDGPRRYSGAVTSPDRPPSVRPVEYKGEPLDAERGPGLGCFWFQLGLLVVLVVLTPLTVVWGWDPLVSMLLLFATLILLLFAGQTVIFLLRLVAADRREGVRHAPRASATPTVGQLEDAATGQDAAAGQDAPTGQDARPPAEDHGAGKDHGAGEDPVSATPPTPVADDARNEDRAAESRPPEHDQPGEPGVRE